MGKSKKADQRKPRPRHQGVWWGWGLAVAILIGIFAWSWFGARGASPGAGSRLTASGEYIRRETRPTLSPALFVGQTARAYQVAREIPEVLDQLYCYCECDKHMGHVSLLSCFTDNHGAT